jgi:chitin-binding protein
MRSSLFVALAILQACLTLNVHADGAIESPPARNWICGAVTKPDHFSGGTPLHPECETAFQDLPMAAYNFMTVVTHSEGRANTTPLPKHVCSFDAETWQGVQTPWDVPMQWPTTPMEPGLQDFLWNGSWGAHFDDTRDFVFWITRPGFVFDHTRELTWDDFEEEPFCKELYDDKTPAGNPDIVVDKTKLTFSIRCQVPARTGHQVVYGEWGRTESTWQRFHGCVDVAFSGSSSLGRRQGFAHPGVKDANAIQRRQHPGSPLFDAYGFPVGNFRNTLGRLAR